MNEVLFAWPMGAHVGSRVPKEKFVGGSKHGAGVRTRFVSEVERVTWAYKLAETTINLPGNESVPEVQVFDVEAKGDDVSNAVLTAIDKAVQFPIVFEVRRAGRRGPEVRMTAAHKQLSKGAPKLSAYFTTHWFSADARRRALPTAITLPNLYVALVDSLTPLTARPGEDAGDVSARLTAVSRLTREVSALERKLRNEPQLNRRFELRRSVLAKQAELKDLAQGEMS